MATVHIPVPLDTPDAAGGVYPKLSLSDGFANIRRTVWAFSKAVTGTLEGAVEIPQNYASGGTITLIGWTNTNTGNVRLRVSSSVVAAAAALDGAYTDESYVNHTVPATAKNRDDIAFTLSTTLAAGSLLQVKATRDGSNGSDTLTGNDWLLLACILSYTA